MKKSLAIAALALSTTSVAFAIPNHSKKPSAFKLPKSCETLAWAIVSAQDKPEAYATLDVDADFAVTVRPNEISIFEIKFADWSTEEFCLIEKVEAFYR